MLPFAAAALTPVVYRVLGERTAYYAAAVALACFGMVASQLGTEGPVSFAWIPSLGVSLRFYVDGLALLIGFLASGVGVLILTYSGGYMHHEPGKAKYYTALLAFMGSMLGVAFAADLVSLFVFWELTSLSSFILIGHYSDQRSSQYAARKSMLITVSGGLFMLIGFLLLANTVPAPHAFDLAWMVEHPAEVHEGLVEAGMLLPVLSLVAIGAAAKSAQVPLHIWLPNAMEAPTPVSAFLHSATMVKAGVYLVGRFRPILLPEGVHGIPEWSLLFTVLGLVTMTVAAILAVAATDIKELLAYSTASHLGLIIAGFGFASELGAETGAFHILNHAVFKAALFLVAGIIAHEAGTRRIAHLGGLGRDLPVTAAITVVAALGMAGVPPFNGFYSKEFLFDAAWHAAEAAGGLAWLYPVVAVFGSVFTFLYSVKFMMLFFGEKPEGLGHVHRPPAVMLVPPAILGTIAALIGLGGVTSSLHLAPAPLDHFVGEVVGSVLPPGAEHEPFHYHLPDHVTPPAVMSATTIALGAAAYPFYDRLHDGINRLLSVDPLRANWWYDNAVFGLNDASVAAIPRIQTGLLRTYATWTLAAVTALALGGYAAASVPLPAFEGLNPSMTYPILLVLLVAAVGAVAVSVAPSHVAGVLTLSILGFMVAVFYVLASAPDLALTQLVVETLSLVIFLLVLDRLPSFYGEMNRGRAIRDGALSVAVGATVFVTVLLSTAAHPDSIASHFTEPAVTVKKAGGHNIVNVILVDFRGFDTMGEISVIAMAALSVLTLIAMRERGEIQ
ncbi:hydrogen gas-evolving membrane-bound hydrogenase subunit E [Haladaptatus salinisoli]|uniref:hydrogen gas-evolving membrane-bound hydrogenase subunit E n=1 Tax=Haladaptatus salinisoli TaxID=2884876 RepID=UPI001D09E4E3|nr:hydrogen gas-evolving membrane-bound hydrogenase subunit E [Haladaptatus salinisoli]